MSAYIDISVARPRALLSSAATPDDTLVAALVERLEREGVALIRGLPFDARRFSALFRSLAPRPFVHGGQRPSLSADDSVQLAEIGQAALRVHCEMAYTPLRPDLCGFCCEVPPRAGGETLICDGLEALRELPEAMVEALRERPMVHVRRYPRDAWERTFKTRDPRQLEARLRQFSGLRYQLYDNGVIETRYEFWALTSKPGPGGWVALANSLSSLADQRDGCFPYVTWADDAPIAPALRSAIVEAFERWTLAHRWRRGDILLIDNWRVLHGRTAFTDPKRRLLAAFGYRGAQLSARTTHGARP